MPVRLICEKCGSFLVYWNHEEEIFVCDKCDHHSLFGDLADQYRCSISIIDFQLREIPEYLYERKYIKKLDFSAEPSDPFHAPFANRISSISSRIGRITDLEELDLSGNILEEVPPAIGDCQNLRRLYLGNNYINWIPAEIGKLKNLETLILRKNEIKSLPDEIGSLTNLKTLNLEDNQLTSLSKTILQLKNLENLRISGNTGLTSPPYAVAKQGLASIRSWFEHI